MPALTTSWRPYRPACTLPLAALLAVGGMPCAAQEAIEGLACVVDGRSLFVGSRREEGQCRGGVKVRLFGIDAPDLEQRCATPTGASYACGLSALTALEELTWRRTVRCEPKDAPGRDRTTAATCFVGQQDLAAEMVRRGWAIAAPRESEAYAVEQAKARQARRGLWSGRFDNPAAWRQDRRQ
jgi:endonuclease YncB( thermonuclease family)